MIYFTHERLEEKAKPKPKPKPKALAQARAFFVPYTPFITYLDIPYFTPPLQSLENCRLFVKGKNTDDIFLYLYFI